MIFLGGIPIDLATDSIMSTIIPSGTACVIRPLRKERRLDLDVLSYIFGVKVVQTFD